MLVKAIGESKSKQEEDRIIMSEVAQLKMLMADRTLSKKRMKEFLIRLVYAEMLGHDASFGYIRAIELTASSFIVHKRTGYLCAALVLSPEHEFRFMMVNQMQRDMDNSNILVSVLPLLPACPCLPAFLPAGCPRARASSVCCFQHAARVRDCVCGYSCCFCVGVATTRVPACRHPPK
jgi:hypothetical protein